MEEQNMIAALEAILFAAGEPLETDRIALTLNIPELEVYNLAELLQERYAQMGSALQVLHLGNAWQIGTRAEFSALIRTALETKRMQPLSNAAMEALTIVAYNQPVSKGFVERVRGIDSSSVVNSLVDKGLLEEAGRIDVPGHPIAYRTTPLFLRAFGLSSLEDLPDPEQSEKFTGEIADMTETEE
ncbi:MAG: SMC-Scp complex subunit ScpB [Ruminococcus sp.]|nr:SMC-Scp complex subunit ScpB [Ruminococcus sp.]